jgi:hypothetical protein
MLLIEMLKNPTIFLFDEPSNDLDYDSLIWLENFMKELDIPLIFVSHDTKLLANVANKIIHLEQVKRRTEAKILFLITLTRIISKKEKIL